MSDEYVESLETHLAEAETKAIRLLAPEEADRRRPGTSEKTNDKVAGWRPIDQGQTTIALESWDTEIDKLKELLQGDGARRLVLDWTLEREESP